MTDVLSHQILTGPPLPTFSRKRRYLLWLLHGCCFAERFTQLILMDRSPFDDEPHCSRRQRPLHPQRSFDGTLRPQSGAALSGLFAALSVYRTRSYALGSGMSEIALDGRKEILGIFSGQLQI